MNGWLVSLPELTMGTLIPISLAAALTLVLCLGIYRNRHPRHRWLRMGLTVLAFVSLCGLVLKPQWHVPQKTHSAILLTTGYDPKGFGEFLTRKPQKPATFALRDVEAPKGITSIPDLAWLRRNQRQITELHVFGYGLDPWDLHDAQGLGIVPHLSPLPLGIEQVHWQREIRLGTTLQIQGILSETKALSCSLILEDPGGKQWALPLPAKNRNFRFQTNPKAAGRFDYKLILKDAEGSQIQVERLPVWVTENEPPKLLLLSSSPSFETRFLKTWFSQGNGSLLIRTRVSEDRFLWSGTQSNHLEFASMSKKVLQEFDLVILDDTVLGNLKPEEITVLSAAVEAGLGLLLVPPNRITPHESLPLLPDFVLKPVGDQETREVAAIFSATTGAGDPIEAEPFEIENHGKLQPLVWDRSQRVLAAMAPRGNGAIGISLITNSFSWVMKQTPQEHAAYWTHLIQALSRKHREEDRWWVSDPWIRIHQPTLLNLASPDPRPRATIEGPGIVPLSLRQDPWEKTHWSAHWWPRESGWYAFNRGGGASKWIYVFGAGAWQSAQWGQRIHQTRIAAMGSRSTGEYESMKWTSRSIPPWLFFLIFFVAVGGLWMEHKVFSPE